MSNKNKAVRIDSWGFEGSWSAPRKGGMPLLGYFLIILGVFLAAGSLWKELQLGASAFFLAVGVLLIVVGLRDKSDLALYCGAFIGAIALSDLLSGMGAIHGGGWGSLFLGIALIAISLLRTRAGGRIGVSMLLGLLLVVWGGSQVANTSLNFGLDRLIVPGLLVLLGVYVISRRSARA